MTDEADPPSSLVAPTPPVHVGIRWASLLSAIIYIAVVSLATDLARENAESLMSSTGGEVPEVSSEIIIQTLVLGLVIGILVGGFGGWIASSIRKRRSRTGDA